MYSYINSSKSCCKIPTNQQLFGPQGYQGTQGSIGAQGYQGPAGQGSRALFQGITGTTGSQGSQGATGSQGYQGSIGTTGTQGYQGSTGTTGAQGYQGSTGGQGYPGITGLNGLDGSTGITGFPGATGAQGSQGNTGAIGVRGATGQQGATEYGAQGGTGAQGATGGRGATGASPILCRNVIAPAGSGSSGLGGTGVFVLMTSGVPLTYTKVTIPAGTWLYSYSIGWQPDVASLTISSYVIYLFNATTGVDVPQSSTHRPSPTITNSTQYGVISFLPRNGIITLTQDSIIELRAIFNLSGSSSVNISTAYAISSTIRPSLNFSAIKL